MFIQVILIFMLCGQIFSIDHAFYMKIKHDGSVTRKINGEQVKLCVKKVWVDLVVQGQYIFRQKRYISETRALFVCKSCKEYKRFVTYYADVILHNLDDREEDEYVLDLDSVPEPSRHFCSPSGKNVVLI